MLWKWHLSARRLKARDGVKKLLMVLDDEYRGMEEGRLDEAAEAFIQCRKMTGESMSRHIRRLKQVRRELEEEDENMYVSEKFFSWLLLRKSGLSSEEKSRIRGAAHCSENAKDIAYAMKRLFPGTLHYRPPERGHHPCRRENGPKHEKNAYVVGGGGDRDSKDDRSDPLPSVPEEESADGSEDSSSDESAESESTPLPENEVMLAMKTVRQAEKLVWMCMHFTRMLSTTKEMARRIVASSKELKGKVRRKERSRLLLLKPILNAGHAIKKGIGKVMLSVPTMIQTNPTRAAVDLIPRWMHTWYRSILSLWPRM